jgi:dTDP-4-dehydrorhamnose reductase
VVSAIRALLKGNAGNRIVHLGGPERMSRYDFGRIFADIFDFPGELVRPILMSDLPGHAPRGRDCSLDIERLKRFGFEPRRVPEGLKAMKQG